VEPVYDLWHLAFANLIEQRAPPNLTLVLVVAGITPTLRDEIADMGWQLVDLGGGYRRIDGAVYDLGVAVTDEVAEAERDGFLAIFSHREHVDPQAAWWLQHWIAEKRMSQKIEDVPGYEEMFQKMLDAFPVEKRLAGVPAEQRLAGLTPEQAVLALPDEILLQLSDAYLRQLSPETQEAVRRRIGRPIVPSA
jgi:hypothetical protein